MPGKKLTSKGGKTNIQFRMPAEWRSYAVHLAELRGETLSTTLRALIEWAIIEQHRRGILYPNQRGPK